MSLLIMSWRDYAWLLHINNWVTTFSKASSICHKMILFANKGSEKNNGISIFIDEGDMKKETGLYNLLKQLHSAPATHLNSLPNLGPLLTWKASRHLIFKFVHWPTTNWQMIPELFHPPKKRKKNNSLDHWG